MLRSQCSDNQVFSYTNATKPVEFLVQLYIVDHQFDKARALLTHVLHAVSFDIHDLHYLNDQVSHLFEQIEFAEKTYLSEPIRGSLNSSLSAVNRASAAIH